jgi:hypothetical protein
MKPLAVRRPTPYAGFSLVVQRHRIHVNAIAAVSRLCGSSGYPSPSRVGGTLKAPAGSCSPRSQRARQLALSYTQRKAASDQSLA